MTDTMREEFESWATTFFDGVTPEMLKAAPQPESQQPISHDWDDQDKCRRCGDRDWYASATCSPKQQPEPDVAGLVEALEREFPLLDEDGLSETLHHCEWGDTAGQEEAARNHRHSPQRGWGMSKYDGALGTIVGLAVGILIGLLLGMGL